MTKLFDEHAKARMFTKRHYRAVATLIKERTTIPPELDSDVARHAYAIALDAIASDFTAMFATDAPEKFQPRKFYEACFGD